MFRRPACSSKMGKNEAAASARRVAIESRHRAGSDGVFFIAVDGHSAAGKSTLADHLQPLLGAAVVHMDDFYRDMPPEDRTALTPEEGVNQYFDWERLRSEALEPLRAGRTARFAVYDWNAGAGLTTDTMSVEPAPFVVLEGCYSARPELDDLIDLRVLVESRGDVRALRQAQRNDNDEWRQRWQAAELHYFRTIRRADEFDIKVAGDLPR